MKSIWTDTAEFTERKPLHGNITVQAAVIGGGIAGILIAWQLRQRGVDVVILEEERICTGQTGCTTAKITCQHNLIYDRLIRQFGRERARLYAKANLAAVGEYEKLIRERKIDCDFSRQTSWLFSTEKVDGVEREAGAARLLGINAEYTTYTGLPFKVKGAVKFEQQAQFHPLKFLKVLAAELTIYEHTRVISLEGGNVIRGRTAEKTSLITDRGVVTASQVVFACHYPFVNFPGLYFARLHQERSYVVALENARMPEGIYLGVDGDKFSLRKAGDLTLLGGCSHRTGGNRGGGEYDVLLEKAQQWFPGSREVKRWSAQDCMSLDGIPYIGRFAASKPHWYVATGFNKWGMTSAMVASGIIPDLICGTENVYAPVFSPQRFNLNASAGNLLCNLGISSAGLVKGAIAGLNTKGKVTKRCSHLGCKLEWNADENTWECPCHGSCFADDGTKLEGPAQTGIRL